MPKIVWSAMSDGSHVHYINGIGTICRKNHRKVDIKGYFAWACATGFLTLVVHLILKSNGL